jgi:hypothetical protein
MKNMIFLVLFFCHMVFGLKAADGVYMFFDAVFGTRTSHMSFEITVNSVARGAIFVVNVAAPSAYTGSTGVAVFVLNQGDDCCIQTQSTYA